jgi:hypothetical protein
MTKATNQTLNESLCSPP